MNDVGLDGEFVADEFGGVGVIGMDATDFGRGEEDVAGFFGGEEGFDSGLAGEVEFGVGAGEDVGVRNTLSPRPLPLAGEGVKVLPKPIDGEGDWSGGA
jgi:hypothetical protein